MGNDMDPNATQDKRVEVKANTFRTREMTTVGEQGREQRLDLTLSLQQTSR